MIVIRCASTGLLLAVIVFVSACGGAGDSFRLGYAEADITPPVGTEMGGYGVPGMNRVTIGTHDALKAGVAIFSNDSGDAFMIISCDLAGYLWDFGDWGPGIKALRQSISDALEPTFAIRPEHIVVTSSHSHGATDLMGFSQPIGEGPDPALLQSTIELITAAAVEAASDMKEVTLLFGSTPLSGLSFRDRDCSPVLDEDVSILQARDAADKVLLTIANFAMHPTTAGEDNRLASADFVWGFRSEMADATGAPAMFLQGFEAAVHGRYNFSGGDDMWDRVYENGADLAAAVLDAQDELVPATDFGIDHRAATYSCVGSESFMVDAVTYMDMPKRFMTKNDDGTITVDEIEISWHRIGPAEFVVFPGEASPEYSVMAKSRMVSPFRFAIGLGNDALGYIVEPESIANDATGQLEGYELKMGLGPLSGPTAWAALEGLGWFDGAWAEGGD